MLFVSALVFMEIKMRRYSLSNLCILYVAKDNSSLSSQKVGPQPKALVNVWMCISSQVLTLMRDSLSTTPEKQAKRPLSLVFSFALPKTMTYLSFLSTFISFAHRSPFLAGRSLLVV